MQFRAADSAPAQLDLDAVVLVDLALRDVLDADVPRLVPMCGLLANPSLRGMQAARAPPEAVAAAVRPPPSQKHSPLMRVWPHFLVSDRRKMRGGRHALCYSCLTDGIAPLAGSRLRREVNPMDPLIAILKLTAALASLAAGIIRVLSAASKSKHDEKRKRVASGN